MTRKIKLPNLSAEAPLWAQVSGLLAVKSSDISKIFGVSRPTANKIVNRIYDYADQQGQPIYQAGSKKAVPTELLFELYGYDEKNTTRRAKKANG